MCKHLRMSGMCFLCLSLLATPSPPRNDGASPAAARGMPPEVRGVFEGVLTRRENETVDNYFKREFAKLGNCGIDFLVQELSKPQYSIIGVLPNGVERYARTRARWARSFLLNVGESADDYLLAKLKTNDSPHLRVNTVSYLTRSDREESFDILASWLGDERVAHEQGPPKDGIYVSARVSRAAYSNLRRKIAALDISPPGKDSVIVVRLPDRERREEVRKLQQWWRDNREQVLARFRERQAEKKTVDGTARGK